MVHEYHPFRVMIAFVGFVTLALLAPEQLKRFAWDCTGGARCQVHQRKGNRCSSHGD